MLKVGHAAVLPDFVVVSSQFIESRRTVRLPVGRQGILDSIENRIGTYLSRVVYGSVGPLGRSQGEQCMQSKNPLKPFVIVAVLGSAYTMYEVLFKHIYEPFAMIAVLLTCILVYLYLKKPIYTGKFFFFSTIPIYPIYFAVIALGLIKPPSRSEVYYILGVTYVVGVIIIWNAKNRYEKYLFELRQKHNE